MYTGPGTAYACSTNWARWRGSLGAITVIPGIIRITPMSSSPEWVGPAVPPLSPPIVPTIFTGNPGYAMSVRTCSWARIDANAANVVANGTLPSTASPADTPIRSCSAMPTLKNRAGCASWNALSWCDSIRSAVNATTSG